MSPSLQRLRSLVTTAMLWSYFVGCFLAGYWLVCLVAGVMRGRRGLGWALASYARGFFVLLGVLVPRARLTVPARRELRRTRGTVVVCNHLSFLDPLLLLTLLPHAITIVRPDLLRLPVFGWILRAAGFLAPTPLASGKPWLEQVAHHLYAGGNLMVFPEGTRRRDGKLAPFKKGAFYLARMLAVPIAVVRIRGTDRLFPPGRASFDTSTSGPLDVRLLVTLPPVAADAETSHELTQRVRRYYEDA